MGAPAIELDNTKFNLLEELGDNDLLLLDQILQINDYSKGETIFVEGDQSDGFHIITDGEIEILKSNESGESETLAIIGMGQPLGEISLILQNRTRTATARSLSQVRTCFFPISSFNKLYEENNPTVLRILFSFAKVLANRLNNMNSAFSGFLTRMEEDEAIKKTDFPKDAGEFRKMLSKCSV